MNDLELDRLLDSALRDGVLGVQAPADLAERALAGSSRRTQRTVLAVLGVVIAVLLGGVGVLASRGSDRASVVPAVGVPTPAAPGFRLYVTGGIAVSVPEAWMLPGDFGSVRATCARPIPGVYDETLPSADDTVPSCPAVGYEPVDELIIDKAPPSNHPNPTPIPTGPQQGGSTSTSLTTEGLLLTVQTADPALGQQILASVQHVGIRPEKHFRLYATGDILVSVPDTWTRGAPCVPTHGYVQDVTKGDVSADCPRTPQATPQDHLLVTVLSAPGYSTSSGLQADGQTVALLDVPSAGLSLQVSTRDPELGRKILASVVPLTKATVPTVSDFSPAAGFKLYRTGDIGISVPDNWYVPGQVEPSPAPCGPTGPQVEDSTLTAADPTVVQGQVNCGSTDADLLLIDRAPAGSTGNPTPVPRGKLPDGRTTAGRVLPDDGLLLTVETKDPSVGRRILDSVVRIANGSPSSTTASASPAAAGFHLVYENGIAVSVPDSWGFNAYACGVPLRDSVLDTIKGLDANDCLGDQKPGLNLLWIERITSLGRGKPGLTGDGRTRAVLRLPTAGLLLTAETQDPALGQQILDSVQHVGPSFSVPTRSYAYAGLTVTVPKAWDDGIGCKTISSGVVDVQTTGLSRPLCSIGGVTYDILQITSGAGAAPIQSGRTNHSRYLVAEDLTLTTSTEDPDLGVAILASVQEHATDSLGCPVTTDGSPHHTGSIPALGAVLIPDGTTTTVACRYDHGGHLRYSRAAGSPLLGVLRETPVGTGLPMTAIPCQQTPDTDLVRASYADGAVLDVVAHLGGCDPASITNGVRREQMTYAVSTQLSLLVAGSGPLDYTPADLKGSPLPH